MKRCPRCGAPDGLINCPVCNAEYLANPLKLETHKVGFFNNDLGTPFADDFKDGDTFTLEDAKLGPIIPTEHGPGQIVFLKINGKRYSIFGTGIANQVQSMESGDLPADVKIIRKPTKVKGQTVKLIVPADSDGTEEIPF